MKNHLKIFSPQFNQNGISHQIIKNNFSQLLKNCSLNMNQRISNFMIIFGLWSTLILLVLDQYKFLINSLISVPIILINFHQNRELDH